MKKLSTYWMTMLVAIMASLTVNAQEEYDMSKVNEMISEVKKNANYAHLDTDFGAHGALYDSKEFKELETECKVNWQKIIEDFEEIEGGDEAKKLVVAAFQALEATDYMSAIENLVTRFEACTITKAIISEVMNPSGRMQAFLEDNYTHARVIAALNKIKAKVADDVELSAEINATLDGSAKLEIDKFRDAHQDTAVGDIPKVLLAE